MEVKKIFVQGAGVMGSGITQVSAQAGYNVILMDVSNELVQKGMNSLDKGLQRGVEKGRISADDKSVILSRVHPTTDLKEAKKADLVIEAVYEDLEVKKKVFRELDSICSPHTIFASNTSAIPIIHMASVTKRPDKVLGIHFMHPVPVMRGIEIIRALTTSDETMAVGREYIQKIGKEAVEAVDYAGFIVSRLLDALVNEAVKCVMDGNKPEDIDKAMKLCANFPMGPCELIDLSGADIVFHGLETLKKDFGERFNPTPLLQQMVRAGHLGRKTGKGFYTYK
jgi:3-hydroxybutyryl-CoA dehydrogenase